MSKEGFVWTYHLEEIWGKRVKAISVNDVATSNPVPVEGVLVKVPLLENVVEDLSTGTSYRIRSDDGRDHRFLESTIELVLDPAAAEPAIYLYREELDILQHLLQSLIQPWQMPAIMGYVTANVGPDVARGLFEKLELIESSSLPEEGPDTYLDKPIVRH